MIVIDKQGNVMIMSATTVDNLPTAEKEELFTDIIDLGAGEEENWCAMCVGTNKMVSAPRAVVDAWKETIGGWW